jgi:hypothetical protein
MDDKEIGRIWAEYYPKLRDNRDAVQIMRDDLSLDTRKVQIRYVYS